MHKEGRGREFLLLKVVLVLDIDVVFIRYTPFAPAQFFNASQATFFYFYQNLLVCHRALYLVNTIAKPSIPNVAVCKFFETIRAFMLHHFTRACNHRIATFPGFVEICPRETAWL